jgi:hypothetical protein
LSVYHRVRWLELVQDTLPKDTAALAGAFALQRFYNDKTRKLYVSHEKLAKQLGCSERTAKRITARLKRANLCRWVQGHYGRSNFYTLTHCDTGDPISVSFRASSEGQKGAKTQANRDTPTLKSNSGVGVSADAAPPPHELDSPSQPPAEEKKPRRPDRIEQIPLNRIQWHLDHGFDVPKEIIDDVADDLRYLIPAEALTSD